MVLSLPARPAGLADPLRPSTNRHYQPDAAASLSLHPHAAVSPQPTSLEGIWTAAGWFQQRRSPVAGGARQRIDKVVAPRPGTRRHARPNARCSRYAPGWSFDAKPRLHGPRQETRESPSCRGDPVKLSRPTVTNCGASWRTPREFAVLCRRNGVTSLRRIRVSSASLVSNATGDCSPVQSVTTSNAGCASCRDKTSPCQPTAGKPASRITGDSDPFATVFDAQDEY